MVNSTSNGTSLASTPLNDETVEPAIRKQLPSPKHLHTYPAQLGHYAVLLISLFLIPGAAALPSLSPTTTTTTLLSAAAAGNNNPHEAAFAFWKRAAESPAMTCACKVAESTKRSPAFIVEAIMIPVLVILSGILAGLTLGYMSLDSTQLNVLSKTGSEKQKYYAKRVIPIRKDGHLLLITLLMANMIVNEALPVIADGVLGGGIQAVVVSTVLVIIFSEIIPQSVCSRFGLAIGSAMVWPVQILIWCFFIVSWPVARLLTYLLGAHSGVVYRRAELKELISMHSDAGGHGGDLNQDTITIVGATLDLQTKVVKDAMTPINKVFQLPITSKLDYETLGRVLKAGHSRIPVYEEVGTGDKKKQKVVGVLLTKQLILLDPEDAVPLKDIPMNALPTVSEDLPLLHILNTFQEGRSHMAIVCRRKPGFNPISRTTSSDDSNKAGLTDTEKENAADSDMEKGEATGEQSLLRGLFQRKGRREGSRSPSPPKYEKEKNKGGGEMNEAEGGEKEKHKENEDDQQPPLTRWPSTGKNSLISYGTDDDYPVGVITLEDVLEELIGEEIYDETDNFDEEGGLRKPALEPFIPPEAIGRLGGGPPPAPSASVAKQQPTRGATTPAGKGGVPGLKTLSNAAGKLGLGMARSRSAPGRSRSAPGKGRNNVEGVTSGIETPSGGGATPKGPLSSSTSTSVSDHVLDTPIHSTEPESLAQINEQSGSDSENDSEQAPTAPGAKLVSRATPPPVVSTPIAPPPPLVGILQSNRRSSDLTPPPGPPTPGLGRVPPLLSDAVLLERGRRHLISQGADPTTLPNLRLAAPRSQPPSRSSTPVPGPGGRVIVPPVVASGANLSTVKKGSFKSPALLSPIPMRQQSLLSESGTTPGSSGANQPSTPAVEGSTSTAPETKEEDATIQSEDAAPETTK